MNFFRNRCTSMAMTWRSCTSSSHQQTCQKIMEEHCQKLTTQAKIGIRVLRRISNMLLSGLLLDLNKWRMNDYELFLESSWLINKIFDGKIIIASFIVISEKKIKEKAWTEINGGLETFFESSLKALRIIQSAIILWKFFLWFRKKIKVQNVESWGLFDKTPKGLILVV